MSTAANYANRRIDLVFLQGVTLSGKKTLAQQLFNENNAGQVCTGIQKLIQRWILRLLTPVGTMKFNPTRGTTFMRDMLSAYNETDVDTVFRLANMDATRQIIQEETPSMPSDERLNHVELLDITFTDYSVIIKVRMYSQTGDSSPVVLPISLNPLPL